MKKSCQTTNNQPGLPRVSLIVQDLLRLLKSHEPTNFIQFSSHPLRRKDHDDSRRYYLTRILENFSISSHSTGTVKLREREKANCCYLEACWFLITKLQVRKHLRSLFNSIRPSPTASAGPSLSSSCSKFGIMMKNMVHRAHKVNKLRFHVTFSCSPPLMLHARSFNFSIQYHFFVFTLSRSLSCNFFFLSFGKSLLRLNRRTRAKATEAACWNNNFCRCWWWLKIIKKFPTRIFAELSLSLEVSQLSLAGVLKENN